MGLTYKHNRIIWRAALTTVLLLAIAPVVLAVPGAALAQGEPPNVAIGKDLVIPNGQTVSTDASVTDGTLVVSGELLGNATVVRGDASVDGAIGGNLVIIAGGNVALGPGGHVGGNVLTNGDIRLAAGSEVGGNVTSVGGTIYKDPGARVKGNVSAPTISVGGVENNIVVEPPPGTPAAAALNDVHRAFNVAAGRILSLFGWGLLGVIVLLLAMALTALVPERIRTSEATLEAEVGPSAALGVITSFLLFPVAGVAAFVLGITIIGLVLIPVLGIAILAGLLYGLVVVGLWLGRLIYDSTRSAQHFEAPRTLLHVVLGVSVLLACTVIPAALTVSWVTPVMLGLLYLASCIGLGAAILSRFGNLAPPSRAPRYPNVPTAPGNTQPLGPAPVFPGDPRPPASA